MCRTTGFFYEKLVKNRRCHSDPNCILSENRKGLVFYNTNNGLGGLSDYMDKHKKKVKGCEKVLKDTITINELFAKYNAPSEIDYLSLDTEGTEYEILRTIDFDKYNINYICVEHNMVNEKRKQIKEFLVGKGYIEHLNDIVNDHYVLKYHCSGT